MSIEVIIPSWKQVFFKPLISLKLTALILLATGIHQSFHLAGWGKAPDLSSVVCSFVFLYTIEVLRGVVRKIRAHKIARKAGLLATAVLCFFTITASAQFNDQPPVYLMLDTTNTAKLVISGITQQDTVEIGEWTTVYSEDCFSPAGNYRTSIVRSIDLDPTSATPIWWAYIITDQLDNEHREVHIMNMIIYTGSRKVQNSTPRPEAWEKMWQRCQY